MQTEIENFIMDVPTFSTLKGVNYVKETPYNINNDMHFNDLLSDRINERIRSHPSIFGKNQFNG